jgi:hypothetical protein
MIQVTYYQAATNDAGEGLWRTDDEAAAHVARIKGNFPAAEIVVNPNFGEVTREHGF